MNNFTFDLVIKSTQHVTIKAEDENDGRRIVQQRFANKEIEPMGEHIEKIDLIEVDGEAVKKSK